MGVGFFIGRNGCNKTDLMLDRCFEEAKINSQKPIFILVPEKYTYEMEKKLSERFLIDRDPYFRIRVVSFSTLSKIIFTNTGGLKERKIDKSSRMMLIYKALDMASSELKTLKSVGNGVGLVNKLMDVIIEFKQNNMSVDDIKDISDKTEDESLKIKLNDLASVFLKYEYLIEDKFLDTEDSFALFSKKLEEFDEIKGATIFVDEFTGFTPIQFEVIEKLILFSENMYFSLMTDLKNFNSRTGVFSKTNITFLKINEICNKYGIKRLKDDVLSSCDFLKNQELVHLEKNINEYKPKKYDYIIDHIHVNEYKNIYAEVEDVAEKIKKLVVKDGYRFNEITVSVRDLRQYSYLIKGIFDEKNIGFFLDEKISAKNNPIIVLILSILDMKQSNYSYNSMFRYLKSGLTGISPEDIYVLENYVIANGIRGKKWFEEEWKYPVNHNVEFNIDDIDVEDDASIEKINDIKNSVVYPIRLLHEKLLGRNTIREICRYIYEFALDINLPKTLTEIIEKFKDQENLYKAKEYSQVWDIFTSMLDDLVEFLGDEKIGLEKFIKLMEAEFEGFELGIIPPARDQIFVTTLDRMKNPNTKVVFILGVNDGVIPSTISDNSMISDLEKEKLLKIGVKFDSDSNTKIFDEQFLIYRAFSTAKERLYLSYCVSNLDGKTLRPSPLIKKVCNMFPELKVISDVLKDKVISEDIKNERDVMNEINSDNNPGVLSIEISKDLYGSANFSISKLERYASCPFSYFMTYGLNAKPREEFRFNSMDSGSYAHKILDDFSKNIILNSLDWNTVDKKFIESEVNRISNNIFERNSNYILNTSDKYKYLTSRINRKLVTSISIMAEQIRRGDFNPRGFEVGFGFKNTLPPIKFKISNGLDVKLRGKIDRVDTYNDGNNDYLMVIDYKSSTRNIDLNRVYYGLQLQLFVYMNALLRNNKNAKPAALLYSKFNSELEKVENYSEMNSMDGDFSSGVVSNNKMNGLLMSDLDLLMHMDNTLGMDNKKSEILPIALKGTKTLEIGSNTKDISEVDFNTINRFVISKSKEICEEIYSGKIDISPAKYENSVPCDYCDYKYVCKFEQGESGNSYKFVPKKVGSKDISELIMLMNKKIREVGEFDGE